VAVSHIHQGVLDLVDVDALIEKFVLRNETRASMFGNDCTLTIISCGSVKSIAVSLFDFLSYLTVTKSHSFK
jgi:hypothetical protein